MSWQVVPDTEVPKVIAASQEDRCVACYGAILQDCPSEHGFYCCGCDDMECDVRADRTTILSDDDDDGDMGEQYHCSHHGTDCGDTEDDLGNFCDFGRWGRQREDRTT